LLAQFKIVVRESTPGGPQFKVRLKFQYHSIAKLAKGSCYENSF
jgi:hypothetical protein